MRRTTYANLGFDMIGFLFVHEKTKERPAARLEVRHVSAALRLGLAENDYLVSSRASAL